MITAVNDASQVAEARRLVSSYARSTGVPEARVGQVAIVVTELATNLLKHAGSGHIIATHRDDGEGVGLELLALDRGNGMADVGRCMDDGYSTAGSPGNGLGAIARLADDIRIYSRPGLGSAIMVRFFQQTARDTPRDTQRTILGAAVAAYPGSTSAATTGRSATPCRAALCWWSMAPATASRRRGPRKWQSRYSASTRTRHVSKLSNGCIAR